MRTLRTILIILLVVIGAVYLFVTVEGKLMADTVPPVISFSSSEIQISVHDPDTALLAGVSAKDNRDGDLSSRILIGGISKLITENTAKVSYLVFDSSDNMASAERIVRYTDYSRPALSLQGSLIFPLGGAVSLDGKVMAEDVIDGDISGQIRVSAMDASAFQEGTYSITVSVTNSVGDTAEMLLPLVVTEKGLQDGEILLSDYLVHIPQGGKFNPMDYPSTAVDAAGRTVSWDKITCTNPVNTDVPGMYCVLYSAECGKLDLSAALAVVVEEGGQKE